MRLGRTTCRRGLPDSRVALRNTNGVVEGQTERLVYLFAALAAIEEVGLYVVKNGEEHTAGFIGGDVSIWASDAFRQSRCKKERKQSSQ